MTLLGRIKLAAVMAAVVCFGSSASRAQGLIGSNVNVGLYVSGDYIDTNYGSTGTDPNSLFLDPDGDPLRNLTVVDGSSLDFFNTYFGTYMTLTFTSAGFTLTNLIPDPFPAANFLGLKIDVLSGPALGTIAIDEAASTADFRQGIVAGTTANQVSVNLAGVCANTCNTVADNVFFNLTPAAVPEPASWAMMLIGFGGVGYALRRRPGIATQTA